MKENKLQHLSDQELKKKRREYLLWGMIPATVFVLLEIYITYNPEYKGMEIYILLGLIASFPFIFQASKYSKEYRRRKK
jgi:Na+/melibiose symporter-like transporter